MESFRGSWPLQVVSGLEKGAQEAMMVELGVIFSELTFLFVRLSLCGERLSVRCR